MEQPLQTLFLQDLRPAIDVRFRPRLFFVFFALAALPVWAFYSSAPLGAALPNPVYAWIACGLVAALLSFKWERSIPESGARQSS